MGTTQYVAIKFIRNEEYAIDAGEKEVKMLKFLAQEDGGKFNLIHFFHEFTHNNRMCIVFELLEKSLYDYVKDNNFDSVPLETIRPIAFQLLTALSKLKSLGIMHTDLKLDNIMIVNSERFTFKIKVIDLGSAAFVKDIQGPSYIQTRFYRSPEILLGLPYSMAIDMWSIGCILVELFLGSPLYPGVTEYDMCRYITQTQGLVPTYMLNVSSKSRMFFTPDQKEVNGRYQYDWRLKSLKELDGSLARRSQETRTYSLNSLDDIFKIHITPTSDQDEDVIERIDRQQFLDLVKGTLDLDQNNRLTPEDALKHTFVTLEHLHGFEHCQSFQDHAAALSLDDHEDARSVFVSEEASPQRYNNPAAGVNILSVWYSEETCTSSPSLDDSEEADTNVWYDEGSSPESFDPAADVNVWHSEETSTSTPSLDDPAVIIISDTEETSTSTPALHLSYAADYKEQTHHQEPLHVLQLTSSQEGGKLKGVKRFRKTIRKNPY